MATTPTTALVARSGAALLVAAAVCIALALVRLARGDFGRKLG